jgi:NMD protein affecting ribosome stability and mRNA decay
MRIDGRTEILKRAAAGVHERIRARPIHCVNCGRESRARRHGRCNACSIHFNKYGVERTRDRFTGPFSTRCVLDDIERMLP